MSGVTLAAWADGSSTGAILVVVAALLEGVAQVGLKRAAQAQGWSHGTWLAGASLLFAVEIAAYTLALQRLPVALAYPLSALSYTAVVVAARLLLGERPGRRRWLGVLLITTGAALSLPGAGA